MVYLRAHNAVLPKVLNITENFEPVVITIRNNSLKYPADGIVRTVRLFKICIVNRKGNMKSKVLMNLPGASMRMLHLLGLAGMMAIGLPEFSAQAVDTHTTITTTVLDNLGPNVNSAAGELCPLISADGRSLYFVRDGHDANWSTQDVWLSARDGKGWAPAVHPGTPVNNRGKNGNVFNISTDGNQLLVRGAWVDGEYESAGISVIKKNRKGAWRDPDKLEVKNFLKYSGMGNYNAAFLSPDGKHMVMYFSDKSNSNKSDLYVSHLIVRKGFIGRNFNNNSWTEPEKIKSLSPAESDDFAPFISPDDVTMYFASDRAGSIGDADIWMSRRLDDTWLNWSTPVNLGPTVNTDKWDAYYSLDARGEEAYMVSSKNSLGGSDIVKIKLITEIRPNPVVLITGKVYNAKTKEPIGASIEYENLVDGKNVGIAVSNPQTGEYKIVLPYGKNYGFLAFAEKHISVSDNLDLTSVAEYKEINRDLYLVPLEVGTTIRLNNIFFDVAKATLRPESYPEIERLAELMKDNGRMQIELSGHTDNVGSDDANMKLSDDRAKAVADYLVTLGVKTERIQPKGYGETKPLGTNDTEEGRQLNRRVEFTILKN
jgi:OmpA-OmpF porin, OOP family